MSLTGIGMFFCDQRFDHVDDLSDMMRRLGYDIWWAHTQGRPHLPDMPVNSDLRGSDILAVTGGRGIDLVVNVRDVTDVSDFGVTGAQQTCQHVKDHGGPPVTDVYEVVNRGPTDVNGHVLRVGWNKGLFFAGSAYCEKTISA